MKGDRWVAVVADGEESTFQAKAVLYRRAAALAEDACTHKHKTAGAARDCARKMAESQNRADRITL